MSAEHGHGHGGDEENRVIGSMRERFKAMADVFEKSFESLAGAFLIVLTLGMVSSFEDSEGNHDGGH